MSNAHGIADAPPWPGVGGWEYSANSGGTYVPYGGTNVGQVVGPTGTQRFRKTFTPTTAGNVQFRFNGDTFEFAANQPAQVYLNGQFIGVGTTASIVAVTTLDLPVVAGVNVLEIWVGQSTTAGQAFLSNAIFDGGLVPCNCCPTGNTACVAVAVAPAFGTAFTAPPVAGPTPGTFVYNNLHGSGVNVTFASSQPVTRPLSIAGPNLLTIGGGQEATYTVTFSASVYLRAMTLNDLDGNSEWFYGASPPVSGTSGAPFTGLHAACPAFALAAGAQPDSCYRDTINNSNVQMLWNQAGPVTALTFHLGGPGGLGEFITGLAFDLVPTPPIRVYSCRDAATGDVQWYDDDGFLIPDANIVPCPAAVSSNPFTPNNIQMLGSAFGDGGGFGNEPLCSIVPPPVATTNLFVNGACLAPATIGAVSLTWNNTRSVQMNYGNPPAVNSGGVIVGFIVDGVNVTWPTNLVAMNIGESRLSNIFGAGHQARLTNLGPADAANAGNGGLRMEGTGGGFNLGIHRLATNNGGLPIGFKLDFIS